MSAAEPGNIPPIKYVLVIEDDALLREAMMEWLAAAGYTVHTVGDGSAGLAAVKVSVPALVVTDIYVPGTSGVRVISELRHEYPKIPVIAISGRFNSGRGIGAEDVICLGAARALSKPFKRSDLVRAVNDLLAPPTP